MPFKEMIRVILWFSFHTLKRFSAIRAVSELILQHFAALVTLSAPLIFWSVIPGFKFTQTPFALLTHDKWFSLFDAKKRNKE
jgi:hypothetical protein